MQTLLDMLPPSDEEAEKGVLGAMLCDSRAAEIAIEVAKPEDFWLPKHRTLFLLFRDLFESNKDVDIICVNSALRDRGLSSLVGGTEYVGKLIEAVPCAGNVERYCRLIKEKAQERNLFMALQQGAQAMASGQGAGHIEGILHDVLETNDAYRHKIDGSLDMHLVASGLMDDLAANRQPCDFWGLPTGIAGGSFDRLTGGIQACQMWVLAGLASIGKSTLVNAIVRGVREKNLDAGMPLIISTEMSEQAVSRTALAAAAGIATRNLACRRLTDADMARLRRVITEKRLAGLRVAYMAGASVSAVRAEARRHKRSHGLPLLVIDMASGLDEGAGSEHERINRILQKISPLKEELNTCVVVCAHLSRSVFANEDRRPMLHHLRDSGEWEQRSDRVLFVHRPGYHGATGDLRTEIIQAKDREHGNVGSIWLEWQKTTGAFVECTPTFVK